MSQMNRAARRRHQKLSQHGRKSSIAGAAAGGLAAAGLLAAPAYAVNTTTYNVELACDGTAADANDLLTRIAIAEKNAPSGETAVVNFLVPAETDCVIDLADSTTWDDDTDGTTPDAEKKFIDLAASRDITINGPTAADSSLTIIADPTATSAAVKFGASSHELTLSNLTIKGVGAGEAAADAIEPLVETAGSAQTVVLDHVTLKDHQIDSASTDAAALNAVWNGDAQVQILDSTISNTRGGDHGAVAVATEGAVVVTDSHFDHNVAQASGSEGGGLWVSRGGSSPTLTVTGTEFHHNSAEYGGALEVKSVPVTVTTSAFRDNDATSASGGAIDADGADADVDITDSDFARNTAQIDGGAIATYGGTVTVTGTALADSTFTDNEATTGDGGAIYAGGDAVVSGTAFDGNIAASDAGAIQTNANDLDVSGSEFTDNTATAGQGGAIYTNNSSTKVDTSTFEGNEALASDGGAILYSDGGTISSSTFVGNKANQGGAVQMFMEGTVTTSTFWNNTTLDTEYGTSVDTDGIGSIFGSIVANDDADQGTVRGYDLGANLVTKAPPTIALGPDWTTDVDGLTANKSKVVTIADLNLQALALNQTGPDNDGATRTVALGDGSVAIDYYTFTDITPPPPPTAVAVEGEWALPATDQRGVDRTLNGATDVGAYEHDVPPAVPVCETTTLGNIRFKADSARLTATSKAKLRVYAHEIADAGCTHITLNGHTSGKGKSAALERVRTKLAKARNAAVKKYLKAELTKLSVTVTFETHVFQANDPLYSNSGSKAYLNRRVQVIMSLPADS